MIKKILPIITLIGASALIVGISNTPPKAKSESFINNINAFKEDVNNYSKVNENSINLTALNKYNLSLETEHLDDIETLSSLAETNTPLTATSTQNNENNTITNEIETPIQEDIETNNEILQNEINDEKLEQISTLYSLSNDIEDSCEDFCELKEDITEAIIETQNLITKLQEKQVELSQEQRMFITEQSQQLKYLGKQLANITTELSFNLSDLNQIMLADTQNIDNLSLKYLVVLDNLVNGNEMLQSGLESLNMINQLMNMNSSNIPSNNQGRVLYGFKHNNNPPVIKDYYINENGEMIENNRENLENNQNGNTNAENNIAEVSESEQKNKTNVDSYKNTRLNSNIDTYANNNLNRNIDSFFNTALLDNDFMYGNGAAYGNGMYGYANPYMSNYANYEKNNAIASGNLNQDTQNNEQTSNNEKQSKKEKKRIKLKKNIDTYKDEDEPDIKTKLGNIKTSITGFFSKFKKSDLSDKVENPVYRYKASNNEEKTN